MADKPNGAAIMRDLKKLENWAENFMNLRKIKYKVLHLRMQNSEDKFMLRSDVRPSLESEPESTDGQEDENEPVMQRSMISYTTLGRVLPAR